MEEVFAEWDWEDPSSRSNFSEKLRLVENQSVSRARMHKIVERMMQKDTGNLNDLVVIIAEQIVVDAIETVMCITKKLLSRAHWGVL